MLKEVWTVFSRSAGILSIEWTCRRRHASFEGTNSQTLRSHREAHPRYLLVSKQKGVQVLKWCSAEVYKLRRLGLRADDDLPPSFGVRSSPEDQVPQNIQELQVTTQYNVRVS